jgi:hypothetical protein
MIDDTTKGRIISAGMPVRIADLALILKLFQLPSDRETRNPKILRFVSQIQREPPRAPVYSYH